MGRLQDGVGGDEGVRERTLDPKLSRFVADGAVWALCRSRATIRADCWLSGLELVSPGCASMSHGRYSGGRLIGHWKFQRLSYSESARPR
jgi:hypothetical protein